jgi:CBS domain-containing protein
MATVSEVLGDKGRSVVCVSPETSVLDAAKRMAQHKIGAVLITRGAEILGIFTERDLLNRVVATEADPRTLPVGEVMTAPVACGTPQTKLAECRAVMTRNRLRHVPIVDGGRLVGIISSGDILARENHEAQETIHYLHEYMYGRA